MIDGLAIAAIVSSLALAVWAFIAAARHQPPTRALFIGLAVVGAVVAVQVVIVIVRLVGGDGPSGGDLVTLVGYLLTTLLLPPAAAVLARMEPTRWGSALVGAAAIIVPVLILRLQQIWAG